MRVKLKYYVLGHRAEGPSHIQFMSQFIQPSDSNGKQGALYKAGH